MHTAAKLVWTGVFGFLIFAGGITFAFGALSSAQTINLPDAAVAPEDDDEPEVKARVARISFIRGEAQLRRSGADEWEKATLNLPIVEGDEIVTEANARIEIQFDNSKHVRLAERSYLKIVNLKDEGIAVSLSLGTLNLRITSFDKDRSYFEIDAPKTTLAVQRSGEYRVDAGQEGGGEVRVTANEGGEARVYSDNAGFTLKNGRSTVVFIDGDRSGEWETADAARYADEFDEWAADRDAAIAKRLKGAYYDQYYDQDIYGADDLNDYGQWVHTRTYGYVWRPHRTSISQYADWSPYRYGHWRWMPPYGWIWVNDEPWGWATYHHGRWVYDSGYWNWSPYGYYRHSRSWWFPALVVINVFNNNVCWYPLQYHHRYYNYNGHHNNYNGGHHNNNNPPPIRTTGGIKPIPPPVVVTGGVKPIKPKTGVGTDRIRNTAGVDVVPPGGVVTVPSTTFGTSIKGIKTAPVSVAASVLSMEPSGIEPIFTAFMGKVGRDIIAERPKINTTAIQAKAGAPTRNTSEPLDNELRTKRVFGGRPPVVVNETGGTRPVTGGTPPRSTGAVDRPPIIKPSAPATTRAPYYQPPVVNDPPVKTPRYDPPPVRQPPRNNPPQDTTPRNAPPPVRQPPRQPPPRQPPPQSDSPPPVRQPPREPPPVKTDPKPLPKVDRKTDGDG